VGVLHANPEFVMEGFEVGHTLIDLHEQVSPGTLHVFIAQLDDHLGEAADGAHGVYGIAFP
jgi:hypothetical protein